MFDLLAVLTLLLSLMAPTETITASSMPVGSDDGGLVSTMDDGSMPPPGKR